MDQEMKALQENQTWILEDLPSGKRAIPCKWIYRIKTNTDGSIDKFKARLVVFLSRKELISTLRGFQTFSPVARSSTI